ncbi:sporulation protein [Vibrio profundum]|uniref:sporulation protein n=1 Tax=Vibrio profundum TaxID=2910247 RepID=UPI003D0A0214
MSFLNKTLSSFGIGSVKVESLLSHEALCPGQTANIKVSVYGGGEEQEVDNIKLKLCCRYIKEGPFEQGEYQREHQEFVLMEWALPYAFTIAAKEERQFDVELAIPWNTPITISDTKVWLETQFEIGKQTASTETQALTVRPDSLMDGVFSALEHKGLKIRRVECEAVDGLSLPYVQEFEFVPTDGPYHGRWRELEVVFYYEPDGVQMWFEIDRHRDRNQGMLASLLSEGKLTHHLFVPLTSSQQQAGEKVVEYLEQTY